MVKVAMLLSVLIVLAITIMGWIFLGWGERIGAYVLYNLFPTTYPSKGERIDIYINGVWNRTATVTACCYDYIVILDAVRCPVDYRGRFYAIGEDANGNMLLYVDKRYHHMVKRAEWIRKICNVPNDFATFCDVDSGKDVKEIFNGIKENGDEVPEIAGGE